MSRIQNRVEGAFFKRLRFAVSLGFVVEIDPAFAARRQIRVMNGKLIPRSFGTVRYDNLVSQRPRAIWRVSPQNRRRSVVAALAGHFHESLVVEVVFAFPNQNVRC